MLQGNIYDSTFRGGNEEKELKGVQPKPKTLWEFYILFRNSNVFPFTPLHTDKTRLTYEKYEKEI